MKKGKILVVGLIALMMAGGLVLAGCNTGCPRGSCTVDNKGNGITCGEGNCAARLYMLNPYKGPVPAFCDC